MAVDALPAEKSGSIAAMKAGLVEGLQRNGFSRRTYAHPRKQGLCLNIAGAKTILQKLTPLQLVAVAGAVAFEA